jgi:hypothetical protein
LAGAGAGGAAPSGDGRDVEAILVIPAIAIPILALISNYRLGAGL